MRLGIFGGTFDPPHLGHLVAASDAAQALRLDRVLWIPAAVHPFKLGAVAASPEARLEMVRAAVAGDERFEACDLELRREGPSYTVTTLRELHARQLEMYREIERRVGGSRRAHVEIVLGHAGGFPVGGDAFQRPFQPGGCHGQPQAAVARATAG